MPSGGVNLQNITDWIQQGSFAIGIGSDLTKSFTGNNYESIQFKAKSYVDAFKKYKSR